jgi:hypothetical protein
VLEMAHETKGISDKQAVAHRLAEDGDVAKLRGLSICDRGRLIELACESAAEIHRSRLATGLPEVERDPWPQSTWDFLREHAARVGS